MIAFALSNNMSRACNKRNNRLAHMRDEANGNFFLRHIRGVGCRPQIRKRRKREGEGGGEIQGMAGDKVGCLGIFPG